MEIYNRYGNVATTLRKRITAIIDEQAKDEAGKNWSVELQGALHRLFDASTALCYTEKANAKNSEWTQQRTTDEKLAPRPTDTLTSPRADLPFHVKNAGAYGTTTREVYWMVVVIGAEIESEGNKFAETDYTLAGFPNYNLRKTVLGSEDRHLNPKSPDSFMYTYLKAEELYRKIYEAKRSRITTKRSTIVSITMRYRKTNADLLSASSPETEEQMQRQATELQATHDRQVAMFHEKKAHMIEIRKLTEDASISDDDVKMFSFSKEINELDARILDKVDTLPVIAGFLPAATPLAANDIATNERLLKQKGECETTNIHRVEVSEGVYNFSVPYQEALRQECKDATKDVKADENKAIRLEGDTEASVNTLDTSTNGICERLWTSTEGEEATRCAFRRRSMRKLAGEMTKRMVNDDLEKIFAAYYEDEENVTTPIPDKVLPFLQRPMPAMSCFAVTPYASTVGVAQGQTYPNVIHYAPALFSMPGTRVMARLTEMKGERLMGLGAEAAEDSHL